MAVSSWSKYDVDSRHVGIGSDFDGIDARCEGIEDVSMYPNLIAEVLREAPETTDEEMKGFLGENVLRVWEKAEKVRDDLRAERPSEDLWDGRTMIYRP
jgi:membrane dipeptidase